MTDLTSAALHSEALGLPRSLRRAAGSTRPDLTHYAARLLAWAWVQWRRRQILNTLRKVDERLLRDAGVEPSELETVVDGLLSRRR